MLGSGGGWLRSRQVFLDFELTFEYRSASDAEAVVGIRAWTTPDARGLPFDVWPLQGVRLRLPTSGQPANAYLLSVLSGLKEQVKVVESHDVVMRPGDEWQKIRVKAEGRRVTVMVNDALAGVFEVERFGGHILFENLKKGVLELRNIAMRATDGEFSAPEGSMNEDDLRKAGGVQPKLVNYVRPRLTAEHWQKYLDRTVVLEAVVLPDGTTGHVRVKRSLDSAVDPIFVAAVKSWKYTAAVLNGRAVPLIVSIEMDLFIKQ